MSTLRASRVKDFQKKFGRPIERMRDADATEKVGAATFEPKAQGRSCLLKAAACDSVYQSIPSLA